MMRYENKWTSQWKRKPAGEVSQPRPLSCKGNSKIYHKREKNKFVFS